MVSDKVMFMVEVRFAYSPSVNNYYFSGYL